MKFHKGAANSEKRGAAVVGGEAMRTGAQTKVQTEADKPPREATILESSEAKTEGEHVNPSDSKQTITKIFRRRKENKRDAALPV